MLKPCAHILERVRLFCWSPLGGVDDHCKPVHSTFRRSVWHALPGRNCTEYCTVAVVVLDVVSSPSSTTLPLHFWSCFASSACCRRQRSISDAKWTNLPNLPAHSRFTFLESLGWQVLKTVPFSISPPLGLLESSSLPWWRWVCVPSRCGILEGVLLVSSRCWST